ncbi:hypothetical protein PG995_014689 [Apiospora arundinis]
MLPQNERVAAEAVGVLGSAEGHVRVGRHAALVVSGVAEAGAAGLLGAAEGHVGIGSEAACLVLGLAALERGDVEAGAADVLGGAEAHVGVGGEGAERLLLQAVADAVRQRLVARDDVIVVGDAVPALGVRGVAGGRGGRCGGGEGREEGEDDSAGELHNGDSGRGVLVVVGVLSMVIDSI